MGETVINTRKSVKQTELIEKKSRSRRREAKRDNVHMCMCVCVVWRGEYATCRASNTIDCDRGRTRIRCRRSKPTSVAPTQFRELSEAGRRFRAVCGTTE